MTQIKSIMTKKILTVPMGTPVPSATALMREKRIRHLPVVDEMDDVVGILSQRDISNCEDMKNIPVELMMSRPVTYVDEKASLKAVTLMMLSKKISCVLIADVNEDVAGIVTTDDLLWYLTTLLEDEKKSVLSPIAETFNLQTIGVLSQQVSQAGI